MLDVFPPDAEPGAGADRVSLADVFYDPVPRPIVGVKIYQHDGDLEELFASWQDLGITAAFVSEELASREQFRDLAANTGTDVFMIFPVLQTPEELSEDPGLFAITSRGEIARDDWVQFACPSRDEFRQRRVVLFHSGYSDAYYKPLPEGLRMTFEPVVAKTKPGWPAPSSKI